MARDIFEMKRTFITNVEKLVYECVQRNLCTGFHDFGSFKEHLSVEFDKTPRAIDYYFDINRQTMPDLVQLSAICEMLYTDLGELFSSEDIHYDAEKASKQFIENVLSFLDSNQVTVVNSTETSATLEITDEIIRNIIVLYTSAKKFNVNSTALIDSVVQEVSETSYYFNGKFYSEEYVMMQYTLHPLTQDEQVNKAEATTMSSSEYLTLQNQKWTALNRKQKLQFWNSYCDRQLANFDNLS